MKQLKNEEKDMLGVILKSTKDDLIVSCTGRRNTANVMKIIAALEVVKYELLKDLDRTSQDGN